MMLSLMVSVELFRLSCCLYGVGREAIFLLEGREEAVVQRVVASRSSR